jgi:hypothetical protein
MGPMLGVRKVVDPARGKGSQVLRALAPGWDLGWEPACSWSPALRGRGRSLMAASWSSLPWSSLATRAWEFCCQDHHLAFSSPLVKAAHMGPARSPQSHSGKARGRCVPLWALGRRRDGGTDGSGLCFSPSGGSSSDPHWQPPAV